MPIYEARPEGLQPLAPTSFEAEGWRERADIQRLLKERIASLEDGLMVLTDEFSGWADSARRIDLLCLDAEARLVVVELKRDEDGGHMELQALRYAAMVSAMTFDQAADTLARHRNRASPDADQARADILAFLGWSTPDEDSFAAETRIILAAADFGKEITTTVLWLRDRGIDIRCIRLRPYRLGEGRLLLDIQQLIPLPEAAEFQTRLGEKRAAERRQKSEQGGALYRFWSGVLEQARACGAPLATRAPITGSWLGGSAGRQGVSFYYAVRKHSARVGFWFTPDGLDAYEALKAQRAAIEAAVGGPLRWAAPPEDRGYFIRADLDQGYHAPEEEWPAGQAALAETAKRLWEAVMPHLRGAGG